MGRDSLRSHFWQPVLLLLTVSGCAGDSLLGPAQAALPAASATSVREVDRQKTVHVGIPLQGTTVRVPARRMSWEERGFFCVRGAVTTGSPLFVVDGVLVDEIPNWVGESGIETIEVVKGSAAEERFGTRGSNGAIMVTTKENSRRR